MKLCNLKWLNKDGTPGLKTNIEIDYALRLSRRIFNEFNATLIKIGLIPREVSDETRTI